MSGPVFVIDVQGQPLMPIAEAHARKLLSSGKARRWPHPTLTILQLTRTVEMPNLRPVFCWASPSIKKLQNCSYWPMDRKRLFLLLSIVVESGACPSAVVAHRGRAPTAPAQSHTDNHPCGWVSHWHFVVVAADQPYCSSPNRCGAQAAPTTHTSVAAVSLGRRASRGSCTTGCDHASRNTSRPVYCTHRSGGEPITLCGRSSLRMQSEPFTATRLTRFVEDGAAETPLSGIAVVGIPAMSGVIDLDGGDDPVVLHVALAADATGVISRYAIVPPNAPYQRWPLSRVAFVPLLPRSAHASIVLYDDALAAYIEVRKHNEYSLDSAISHRMKTGNAFQEESAHDDCRTKGVPSVEE